MHIALLLHGEVGPVRLRAVWITRQTCKNVVSKMTFIVSNGC